jgi:AcrR family transcriptional regulator
MKADAKEKTNLGGTRQRLLDAAARLFGRDGLEGATTRDIAREAGVNEVTLFRHFLSKEKLLSEVLRRTFDRQEETLATEGAASRSVGEAKPDLRAGLRSYAGRYHDLLQRNLPLLRTLIGEIHRHREHEVQVFKAIFNPLKAEVIRALEAARADGLIRAELDPVVIADMFGGMIFIEVLRRGSSTPPEYPSADYLAICVDVFARGIE